MTRSSRTDSRRGPSRIWGAAALLVALALTPMLASSTAEAQGISERSRVRIARRLARSTVSVLVGGGSGSGFIIGDEHWIVTNHHVVADSLRGVAVRIRFGSGTEMSARVLELDEHHDLALLAVDGRVAAPPLELGDSDGVQVGESVLAFGSPFGLEGTLTEGIVSARRDIAEVGGGMSRRLIQTDAPINPGNSGGPLVDARGRVVGVNTAIIGSSSAGIGFAVPATYVRELVERVREREAGRAAPSVATANPESGLPVAFGVVGADFTSGATSGVRVERTLAGSPAQRAGILGGLEPAPAMVARSGMPWNGHIITAIDGHPIATVAEMRTYLATRTPGQIVRLTVTLGAGSMTAERDVLLGEPAR